MATRKRRPQRSASKLRWIGPSPQASNLASSGARTGLPQSPKQSSPLFKGSGWILPIILPTQRVGIFVVDRSPTGRFSWAAPLTASPKGAGEEASGGRRSAGTGHERAAIVARDFRLLPAHRTC